MVTRWRYSREDADESGYLIVHETDRTIWYCDSCGQCNDPAHHGGEWPTCVYCGTPREDWDAPQV